MELKTCHPHIGLTRVCQLFGVSRQAYYQHCWDKEAKSVADCLVLSQIQHIRALHKAMGTRKLHKMTQAFMLDHGIKMGRDALFELLAQNGSLVRKSKRKIQTTNSCHWLRKWPNLITGLNLKSPDELYVSDITYWKIQTGHVYISFITDAYSHKIVGYHVANSLEALESLLALEMALEGVRHEDMQGLIHHSDRGVQYCSDLYVKLLQSHKIRISMTEKCEPTENAIAERVNGIMKEEYLNFHSVSTLMEAREAVKLSVELYNQQRPHLSIGMQCPQQVHEKRLETKNLWKKASQVKSKGTIRTTAGFVRDEDH